MRSTLLILAAVFIPFAGCSRQDRTAYTCTYCGAHREVLGKSPAIIRSPSGPEAARPHQHRWTAVSGLRYFEEGFCHWDGDGGSANRLRHLLERRGDETPWDAWYALDHDDPEALAAFALEHGFPPTWQER